MKASGRGCTLYRGGHHGPVGFQHNHISTLAKNLSLVFVNRSRLFTAMKTQQLTAHHPHTREGGRHPPAHPPTKWPRGGRERRPCPVLTRRCRRVCGGVELEVVAESRIENNLKTPILWRRFSSLYGWFIAFKMWLPCVPVSVCLGKEIFSLRIAH